MIDIAWQSLLEEVRKPLIHLCPSVVEDEMSKDEEVVETSGQLLEKDVKDAQVPQKGIPHS